MKYSKKELTKKSRFLSMILRHHPEVIQLKIDKYGWGEVSQICNKMHMEKETLDEIVKNDTKGRYEYNEDETFIRATQGHSINVDVSLQECKPPDILYHGTSKKAFSNILATGIVPNGRLYVHLSLDYATALSVGNRHGKPVVLKIDSRQMYDDGYTFFKSKNNVWLIKYVPIHYLTALDELSK